MGVVNVTPDSFSDGGRHADPSRAIEHGLALRAQGADILDVGGESTRPGAAAVSLDEELRRVIPVVEALAKDGALVSVDTMKPEVMQAAIEAGGAIVNDVNAFRAPRSVETVAAAGVGVIAMHMQGTPATMQVEPSYDDVSREVRAWLADRLESARAAGIDPERVVVDPGIGFGKTLRHNLELLARLDEWDPGRPVLVGLSRKSFLGRALDLPVDQRLEGGLAATAVAVFLGARVVRTHDVAATVRAVRIADALRGARREA